jgi:BlaR1 peptidase M56/Carboxypeptidase regulatory-like domain
LLVHWLRRSSRLLGEASVRQLRDDISLALGIRRAPQILASRRVTTPVAVGLLRPMVILPERLIGEISDEQMRDVLLHELAYVSRRDTFFVLVQELVRTLYLPILPVHGLIRELGRAREELCDNYVLQSRDAVSYGETLLHLAELSLDAKPLGAAVGILHWRGELERRIAGFLEEGRSTMTRSNRWLVCIVALLFLVGGAIASSTRLTVGREINQGESAPVQVAKEVRPEAAANAQPAPQPQEKRSMLVHVLGPDGQPMAGVKIHRGGWTRKPIANANMNYVSDENGEARVDLPDGIYIFRLWARAKGHAPLFAHWEEEDVPERSLPKEFTFRLQLGTVIGGIVSNSNGQPIKGVSVDVMLNRGGQVEGRTGLDMWLSEGEVPITDAEGRWTLDNIPPSLNLDIRLKLSHPDYISDREWGESQDQQGVDLKALRSRQATIIMQGGLVATGTVIDPQGKPIAGAVVVRGDQPYMEVGSQEVRTDEHGRYQFPPLSAGSLTVTVIAQGWMPALRKVEIRPGMPPFDFRLEPGKELSIRLVDGAGKSVPGVYVGIAKWRGGESLYNHWHPSVLDMHIPVQADEKGLFRWSWAPGDAVTYWFHKEGFVRHEAMLTASASEQTVTLPQTLRISGKVTNAATGQPVKGLTAIPVVEFRPGFLHVARNSVKGLFDGSYELEADRTDVSYRVRVEADGYRSAMSDVVHAGVPTDTLDFRLDAAPPLTGRVFDPSGRPVKDARVYLATLSQDLKGWPNDHNTVTDDQKVITDEQGRFSLPAQFERYTIVAVDDRGYAEVTREPSQQPGDLTLRDWARVEGRLHQAGQPVTGVWVGFYPRVSTAAYHPVFGMGCR